MSIRLTSPYIASGCSWVKGNLHTHTTLSDGSLSPDETAKAYARLGYGFLCVSDHDTLTWPVDAPDGLTLVPGLEVSGGPHVLAVNVEAPVAADLTRQSIIDEAVRLGGFAILNHPNWGFDYAHFPQVEMEALERYAGIEIYNAVVEVLEGSSLATDRWDQLLSKGRRVWGFAHDDTHHEAVIGHAWNVVQVKHPTRAAICEALVAGRFYASTGVDIRRIAVSGDTISVQAPNAQRLCFYGSWGRLLHYADDCEAGYQVGGREGGYVRIECLGRGGRRAWTQPIFIEQEWRAPPLPVRASAVGFRRPSKQEPPQPPGRPAW